MTVRNIEELVALGWPQIIASVLNLNTRNLMRSIIRSKMIPVKPNPQMPSCSLPVARGFEVRRTARTATVGAALAYAVGSGLGTVTGMAPGGGVFGTLLAYSAQRGRVWPVFLGVFLVSAPRCERGALPAELAAVFREKRHSIPVLLTFYVARSMLLGVIGLTVLCHTIETLLLTFIPFYPGFSRDANREAMMDKPRIAPTTMSTRLWLCPKSSQAGRPSQRTINILNPMNTSTSASPYFR